MKIIKVKAKSIFTKTGLPGSDWTINQYVGCEHNCLYCYSGFMCRWKPYGKWGTWVEVKENAPELVKGNYVRGWVWMSSVSDPYQPIEKKLKLTRRVLENMNKRIKLTVQTKSDLILRDIDLFKEFKNIEIGLTINGFEGKIKKLFEPFSSTHKERVHALKILKKNKLRTYAFISPIIPELVNVKKCIKETKNFVDYYWFEILNLRASGEEFIKALKTKFPKSYKVMANSEKFSEFLEDLKDIIKKENIKSAGIEIHFPKWKTIKV
ncbi:MAG: radical SAM protein [Patescibacteria group bacterium]|nr:radical SAM protein [Patescibacteria group bacterium]